MFVIDFTNGRETIPQVFDPLEDEAASVALLVRFMAKDGWYPVKDSKRPLKPHAVREEPKGLAGFRATFLGFKSHAAFIIDRRVNPR